jgi:hypothetical protein
VIVCSFVHLYRCFLSILKVKTIVSPETIVRSYKVSTPLALRGSLTGGLLSDRRGVAGIDLRHEHRKPPWGFAASHGV